MFLAIDIGNTNITIGVFALNKLKPSEKPLKIWRLYTNPKSTADEYAIRLMDLLHYSKIDSSQIKGIAVASVVPTLDGAFMECSKNYFKTTPYFITSSNQKLLKILYKNPLEVGADRIANAAAAFAIIGGPVIVLDFGTATTFDCVNKKGHYLGGVILPGPMIAAESLSRRTAKLPKVEIVKPKFVIGNTTVSSMQSGIYYGYAGMIKELLKRITKEMGAKTKVIATGGLASLMVDEIKEVKQIIPELTLEGIKLLWQKSRA